MRPLINYIVVSILVLGSCNYNKSEVSHNHNISLAGKWHRFSMANGYSEFDFDSLYVVFFNQKVGRIKLEYKIEKDSFKYLTHKYAAKITDFGDSIFLEGNDNTTATLYRFNEPDIPFDSIPEEKDSLLFDAYVKGFDKRTIREYEKAGIVFLDKEAEENDTTFQQLLKLKNQ